MYDWDWNFTTNLLALLASVSLFICGIRLLLKNNAKTGAVAITAALFLVIILSGTKYKHFEGLGFKVDAWEQTEKQAQELVERLTFRTEIATQQLSILAARTGFFDSALSISELMDMLIQNKKVLDATQTSKRKQAEINKPIIDKIKLHYMLLARDIATSTFKDDLDSINKEISKIEERKSFDKGSDKESMMSLSALRQKLSVTQDKIERVSFNELIQQGTTSPLIDLVKARAPFPKADKLISILNRIEDDLQFFTKNEELKEDITSKDLKFQLDLPLD